MTKKLLDKPTPTVDDLAKKYGVSVVQVKKQLMKGIKVEKEHTNHTKIAREIALDHLGERLDYYTKLDKAHLEENNTGNIHAGGALGAEEKYIGTNMIAYEDDNGDKFKYIQQAHLDHHNKALGFNHFNPTEIRVARNHHLQANAMMKEATSTNKELIEARQRVGKKLDELGGSGEPDAYNGLSDPPPKGRRDVELEEGPKLDKAKRAAAIGMTLANMGTLAHIGGNAAEGRGSPKDDILPAVSTMSGPIGYGAMTANYAKKGYDLAKDALKKKKAHMEEEKKMSNPCWKGYKAYGMKKKNGKEVPNCVPVEEQNKYPETAERSIYEKKLTPAETKKKEEIVMSMKKGLPGMKKRYGDRAKEVLYATATKRAKQVAEDNINEDGFDLDAVTHAIRSKESRNNYDAKSKSSSASGAYQYINKTWKGSASKYGVDTKQYPTARSAPKEVQDKVFTNDLSKNAKKYGSLEKAVNVHYTGNPGGKVSAAGLKANRGQTGGGYMADIKKKVDDYNTERKSTMGAAQQMAANFSGGKSLSTPDSTQFAKAPETPKPTQVASKTDTPKLQNPDQNITKVASTPAPTQVSQLDTKDKQKVSESAAWQRSAGKDPKGGLNRKGIASYRREHPGSHLSMAVTTKPSKLKPGSKAANRRKSFCARMGGMKGAMKDEKGRPTRKALALRKWNCEESVINELKIPRGKHNIKRDEPISIMKRGDPLEQRKGKESVRRQYHDQFPANYAKKKIAKDNATPKDEIKASLGKHHKPSHLPEQSINELKAETLGSYVKKASASRKKALEASKTDIKTWGKRQKGITTAVKQLTKENSKDKDFDAASGFTEQQSHIHLNKQDVKYAPGATGTTKTIHEETKMENKDLINEAIENILENDLGAMKDNFMTALQEKAQEKLEERKKQIASDYFAQ